MARRSRIDSRAGAEQDVHSVNVAAGSGPVQRGRAIRARNGEPVSIRSRHIAAFVAVVLLHLVVRRVDAVHINAAGDHAPQLDLVTALGRSDEPLCRRLRATADTPRFSFSRKIWNAGERMRPHRVRVFSSPRLEQRNGLFAARSFAVAAMVSVFLRE